LQTWRNTLLRHATSHEPIRTTAGEKEVLMRRANFRCFCISAAILLVSYSLQCGDKLAIARPSAGVLEIRLANSDEVAGVQFSVHASSDIVLGALNRGSRVQDPRWIVDSYAISDTVVNVVILSSTQRTLSVGEGVLIRIAYTESKPSARSAAVLTNVMIAGAHADSLAGELEDLTWSENRSLAGDINGSKISVLEQNYPNPFNPSTVIAYQLHESVMVRLSIYDIAGREVARLVDQFQNAGEYSVKWYSDSENGVRVASGLYFARLIVGNESQTRRMMLIK
jgi:hypothetical protein